MSVSFKKKINSLPTVLCQQALMAWYSRKTRVTAT